MHVCIYLFIYDGINWTELVWEENEIFLKWEK